MVEATEPYELNQSDDEEESRAQNDRNHDNHKQFQNQIS